jgi:hypothetical protein
LADQFAPGRGRIAGIWGDAGKYQRNPYQMLARSRPARGACPNKLADQVKKFLWGEL